MREILFRGKRLQGGDWVEGYFFKSDINTRERESGKATLIFTPDCNTFITVPECNNSFMVVSDTVGQYTGLIDKNGVNIFEGDIVDLFGMKGKVVQECGAFGIGFMKTIDYDLLESNMPFNNSANFCFNDNFISLWEVFWNYEQDDNPLYEVEIIGNIHDNPEMLKGSNLSENRAD